MPLEAIDIEIEYRIIKGRLKGVAKKKLTRIEKQRRIILRHSSAKVKKAWRKNLGNCNLSKQFKGLNR